MSNKIKYEFIGWYRDEEKNSDKVWGVIKLNSGARIYHPSTYTYVTFWGRRGKKLQTKTSEDYEYDIEVRIDSKIKKGYERVNKNRLDEVYPEFETDLEKTAVWAILKMSFG